MEPIECNAVPPNDMLNVVMVCPPDNSRQAAPMNRRFVPALTVMLPALMVALFPETPNVCGVHASSCAAAALAGVTGIAANANMTIKLAEKIFVKKVLFMALPIPFLFWMKEKDHI